MSVPVKKIAIGAVAALALSSAFATPASAWCNAWGCGGGGGNAGAAAAAGLVGGLALGAVAASAAQQPRVYYVEPADGGCWLERRPVYDEWGNYIGRRRIRVCE